MGGDKAPDMVIEGAGLAHQRFPEVRFALYGVEQRIKAVLARVPGLAEAATIHHTDSFIANEDKPSAALRQGRQSSMRLAIDAVLEGRAAGVVSAGNTGALMAMGKVVLRTVPGIDRPAIASYLPTLKGEVVMLDLGANVDCDADILVQFAVMGEVFARTILGIAKPTIGLLNVGIEDLKGNDQVKRAAQMLRGTNLPIHFHGFIEGDDIAKGTVDVVVTDGFSGNIALKTAEGTVKLVTGYLREALRGSWRGRLGYMIAQPAIDVMRKRIDPRRYNGAILVGLNGIVVKSHGGTDATGFANAIKVAIDMASNGFVTRIMDELAGLKLDPQSDSQAAQA
jgi:glycerol-3-phosphate acyltransferase PlsX